MLGESLLPRKSICVLVVASMLCSTGCALTFDATHLGVPVTMAGPPQSTPGGTPFHVTRHPVYLFLGLARVGTPDLEDVLEGEVGSGAGVQNLRINVAASPTDVLFTVLTLGLISPRTVTFEGEVVAHQH